MSVCLLRHLPRLQILEKTIEGVKPMSAKVLIALLVRVQKMRGQEPSPKPTADEWTKGIFRLEHMTFPGLDQAARVKYYEEAITCLRKKPQLELCARLAVQAFLLGRFHETLECAGLSLTCRPAEVGLVG